MNLDTAVCPVQIWQACNAAYQHYILQHNLQASRYKKVFLAILRVCC